MRIWPAVLLVCNVLVAQDPLSEFLMEHHKDQAAGPYFSLLTRKGEFMGPWQSADVLLRLRAGRELGLAEMEEPVATALWARENWQGPHWALLDPKGEIALSGAVDPDPDGVVSAMRERGWTPLAERREIFIRAHPDQIDARVDALKAATSLVIRRLLQAKAGAGPGVKVLRLNLEESDRAKIEETDQIWQEAAEALAALRGSEGWPRVKEASTSLQMLRFSGAAGSKAVRDLAPSLLGDVEAELHRRPSDPGLWKAWSSLAFLAPGSHGVGLLDSLEGVPGKPWPPYEASLALVAHFRDRSKDWAGLLQFAESQWTTPPMLPPGQTWTASSWRAARVLHIRAWGEAKSQALQALGRKEELRAWLGELKAFAGSAWPTLLAEFKEGDPEFAKLLPPEKPLLADPAMPAPTKGLRVLWGGDADTLRDLRGEPSLAAYGPGELRWECVSNNTGWAIADGETVSAFQPIPAAWDDLPKRLREIRPPYVEILERFVGSHPDHAEARKALITAFRERMPQRELEEKLLAAARPGFAFHPGSGWAPDPERWGPAALRVLPNIQAGLEKRPSDPELWMAWLDWASVHPAHPSAWDLVQSLPIWGPKNEWAWALPEPVGKVLIAQLRGTHRWEDLRAWTQAQFDLFEPEDLKDKDFAQKAEELVVLPLQEALRAESREEDANSIVISWAKWKVEAEKKLHPAP